jgi:hypothetical protein
MNLFILISALAVFLGCGWLRASADQTPPQALQAAFPSYQVDRKTLFLTPSQIQQIEQLSRTKTDSSIISYYVARSSAGIAGIAFFDRRMVRTLPVTYMTVLNLSGTIQYVDILSFEEPEDYFPPARWLALYKNRALDDHLAIGNGIPHITGASLTSQAMNDGIRLMLAIYQVGVKKTL